ncbi:hypothetical protein E3N88_01690 [Mikania micrantha]|uniref:Uncharacterized protein n=1 Tax=Mikania micrantha TaxID=192012 RepID=A0A5N6Q1N2_9ASTR|nr:hypothetical protein E3N88_01690 [Mikania micrantha]
MNLRTASEVGRKHQMRPVTELGRKSQGKEHQHLVYQQYGEAREAAGVAAAGRGGGLSWCSFVEGDGDGSSSSWKGGLGLVKRCDVVLAPRRVLVGL